jgi:hypothetical protein
MEIKVYMGYFVYGGEHRLYLMTCQTTGEKFRTNLDSRTRNGHVTSTVITEIHHLILRIKVRTSTELEVSTTIAKQR